MSSVTYRGMTVSRADVLRALAEFDAAYGDNSKANDFGYLNAKTDLDH